MSSENSEAFEALAADVLDLMNHRGPLGGHRYVETVCDLVGEEMNMSEDQVEALIQEMHAEGLFSTLKVMAHGDCKSLIARVKVLASELQFKCT